MASLSDQHLNGKKPKPIHARGSKNVHVCPGLLVSWLGMRMSVRVEPLVKRKKKKATCISYN